MVLLQSSSNNNPEGRMAGSSELPDSYEAIFIGTAALAGTTAAGDADGVTAMKRLCGSVSRAAVKPPRPSTTNRECDLLEGWRRRGPHHARSTGKLQSHPQKNKEVCVEVCREHSDCHRQRRPSWHRPSRVSTNRATHAPGRAKTEGREE
ncbi:hypothetical protein TcCL_ESM02171 [Trypanosoma cruzi]|nr:hypothetical protein TcCL_ESM02171 [Trypanosoma cruzi]